MTVCVFYLTSHDYPSFVYKESHCILLLVVPTIHLFYLEQSSPQFIHLFYLLQLYLPLDDLDDPALVWAMLAFGSAHQQQRRARHDQIALLSAELAVEFVDSQREQNLTNHRKVSQNVNPNCFINFSTKKSRMI